MRRFLWASYGLYFLGGMTSVFFGAIMPELLSHYQTSYTSGGLLILLQSIGFIIGVPITTKCMAHFHYRFILSASALAVVLAQAGILFLPPFIGLAFLVILNGMGASALETAVASYIMELYEGRRAIFMSRLEVAFGLGALGFPAIASGLIALHAWRFSALIVGGMALALALIWQTVSVSLQANDQNEQRDAEMAAAPIFNGKLIKYSVLSLFLLLIFVYVGVEGSLNSFLPSLFITNLKATPYIASLSASAFWMAMVAGRLSIGWIVQRVTYEKYLYGSMIVTTIFLSFLALSRSIPMSFIIVLGMGLGMAAIYSITMVFANHTFPNMTRIVTSSITAFAGVGGACFPALIGVVMDHFMPNQVLWVITGFTLLLLLLLLVISLSLRLTSGLQTRRTVELKQNSK